MVEPGSSMILPSSSKQSPPVILLHSTFATPPEDVVTETEDAVAEAEETEEAVTEEAVTEEAETAVAETEEAETEEAETAVAETEVVDKVKKKYVNVRAQREAKQKTYATKQDKGYLNAKKNYMQKLETIHSRLHQLAPSVQKESDYIVITRDVIHKADCHNPSNMANKYVVWGAGSIFQEFIQGSLNYTKEEYYLVDGPHGFKEKSAPTVQAPTLPSPAAQAPTPPVVPLPSVPAPTRRTPPTVPAPRVAAPTTSGSKRHIESDSSSNNDSDSKFCESTASSDTEGSVKLDTENMKKYAVNVKTPGTISWQSSVDSDFDPGTKAYTKSNRTKPTTNKSSNQTKSKKFSFDLTDRLPAKTKSKKKVTKQCKKKAKRDYMNDSYF